MFFHFQVGSLVDHRAYKPYTLVEPPALQMVLDPLAVLHFNNGLYINFPNILTKLPIKFYSKMS